MSAPLRDRIIDKIRKFVADLNKLFTAYDVNQDLRLDSPADIIRHHEVRDIVHGLFLSRDPVFEGMLRTPILLANGKDTTWCYHHQGQDPRDHPAAFKSAPPADDDDDDLDGAPVDPLLTTVTHHASPATATPRPPDVTTGGVDAKVGSSQPLWDNATARAAVTDAFLADLSRPPADDDQTPDDEAAPMMLITEAEGRLNIPAALVRGVLGVGPGRKVIIVPSSGTLQIYSVASPAVPQDTACHVNTVTVKGNVRIGSRLLDTVDRLDLTAYACTVGDGVITIGR